MQDTIAGSLHPGKNLTRPGNRENRLPRRDHDPPMHPDLKRVKEFEAQLDRWLHSFPTIRERSQDTLVTLGNLLDTAGAIEHALHVSWLSHGFDVLLPHIIASTPGPDADYETLLKDLWKASRYYSLRELLYYTYNVPSAISWDFDQSQNQITISYADRTLPRQFYLTWNNHMFSSREISEAVSSTSSQIEGLLAESPEFRTTEDHLRAWPLLEREADEKLRRYYCLLDPSSTLDLGGYTYAQFYAVYRSLLIKALYHRYLGHIRGGGGAITINKEELIAAITEELGLDQATTARVLADITYGERDGSRRLNPVYFSLYELPDGNTVMMIPATFAVAEGLVSIFRLVGLRNPKLFSRELSTPLSNALVARVRKAFEAHGFQCRSNVRLDRFDSSLPDIDLLVISEELTLGYHIFLLEIKNPIPPQWAKDQLRALAPDSVAKAFSQLDRISEFLRTNEGTGFIRSLLPPEGLPHFGPAFVTIIRSIVVTSNNAGMFFGDVDHSIIDYRTLDRIIRASDGDVTYINHALSQVGTWVDSIVVTTYVEVDVDGTKVRFEGVTGGPILEFNQTEYRSVGLDQQIARDFRESGGHPFDVFATDRRGSKGSEDVSGTEG
jgi:hypothetical protein